MLICDVEDRLEFSNGAFFGTNLFMESYIPRDTQKGKIMSRIEKRKTPARLKNDVLSSKPRISNWHARHIVVARS